MSNRGFEFFGSLFLYLGRPIEPGMSVLMDFLPNNWQQQGIFIFALSGTSMKAKEPDFIKILLIFSDREK